MPMCFMFTFYVLLFNTNYIQFFSQLPLPIMHKLHQKLLRVYVCIIKNGVKYHLKAHYFHPFSVRSRSLEQVKAAMCLRYLFFFFFPSNDLAYSGTDNKQFNITHSDPFVDAFDFSFYRLTSKSFSLFHGVSDVKSTV